MWQMKAINSSKIIFPWISETMSFYSSLQCIIFLLVVALLNVEQRFSQVLSALALASNNEEKDFARKDDLVIAQGQSWKWNPEKQKKKYQHRKTNNE